MTFTKTTRTLAAILATTFVACATPEEKAEQAKQEATRQTIEATAATYFAQPGNVGTFEKEGFRDEGVAVATGDLDDDGVLDIITGGSRTGIRYFHGTREGTYTYSGTVGTFEKEGFRDEGVSIALRDIDGDGKLDIITGGSRTGLRYIISHIQQNDPFKDIKKH